jgi:hypothetical protein
MCGDIPPFPSTPSWHGAQLKKKAEGQICLYTVKGMKFIVRLTYNDICLHHVAVCYMNRKRK